MRLPPRGVVRFLRRHVLKLEFWHFSHSTKKLDFVFASVFAVFSTKKVPHLAHCTVQKHAHLFLSHLFFRCFPVSVASPSVFAVFWPSLDFLHMPASTCICLSSLCGVIFLDLVVLFGGAVQWLGGGGVVGGWVGGVMTSMRMRLVFSFLDLVVLFGGAVQWWRGGG